MGSQQRPLTVQSASAGSGKTFKLTLTYILDLLSEANEDGKDARRLRREEELGAALSGILAVTFTNKATDEMKTRIVTKLHALSTFVADGKGGYIDPATGSAPDYLKEICDATGADAAQVRHLAAMALSRLLFRYSDFNVSTIDSFFQSILRTFAFEADMNDSYELELDSVRLAREGVDTMLESTYSGTPGKIEDVSTRTLKRLMSDRLGGNDFENPFLRKESKGFRKSFYISLVDNIVNLEKEAFKSKRERIDEYFAEHRDDFGKIYRDIDRQITGKLTALYKAAGEKAEILTRSFESHGMDVAADGAQHLAGRIALCHEGAIPTRKVKMEPTSGVLGSKQLKKIKAVPAALQEAFEEWGTALAAWRDYLEGSEMKLWRIYRELLLLMPMMLQVSDEIAEMNKRNNVMPLADTNTLLKRVIGDKKEVVPFIYERVGSRIRHYLIDEFQDTSRMQWDNFKPLVSESLGWGHGNLIIGDAKQSIYRWRDADSTILTQDVPEEFGDRMTALGSDPADNTNWRSAETVVRFNNDFFKRTAERLRDEAPDIAKIYSNVEQASKKMPGLGYVQVTVIGSQKDRSSYISDDSDDMPKQVREIGETITSLIKRGYKPKEIAVLTRKRKEGTLVVEALNAWNSSHPGEKVDFVSDESLLISNSRSVGTIISIFRDIVRGDYLNAPATKETEGTGEDKKYIDPHRFMSRAIYLRSRDSDASTEEILKRAIEEGDGPVNELRDMLMCQKSEALPALTEAITERFISEDLRCREAAYIAAFQDAVLSYCDNNSSDMASFLEWWERVSGSLSITPPADSDAVSIMTYHKSKGLEFDCVLLPYFNEKTEPTEGDWRWVKPSEKLPGHDVLPPFVPIKLSKNLEGTPHEGLWKQECEATCIDALNTAYVAMTRASKELYIYAVVKGKGKSISGELSDYLKSTHGDRMTKDADENEVYHIGKPLTEEEIKNSRKNDEGSGVPENIGGYPVYTGSTNINCTFGDKPARIFRNEEERRLGTALHAVMEGMRTEDDLDRSLRKAMSRGILTRDESGYFRTLIKEGLDFLRACGYNWFGDGLQAINEREIVYDDGNRTVRPDRIVVDKEGYATVIDYKFGAETHTGYRKQVKRYMDYLRETEVYRSVRGYIWYVRLRHIDQVE